ncbi:SRPBCC family protein [Cytobacillus gottheilii]|uniref:SRPBCC family protein n=1 Tax=Cytobacillus gottheilii TaxID=859144 RepID=UPI002493DBC0|nr:SRPBCC family protein [Cytobacillus gottheilii]
MREIECYTFENEIEADIQLVFECLNDDEHVVKWNSQIIENISVDPKSEIKVGSTFITRQKIDKKVIEVKATYSEYNPPYVVAVEADTKEGISRTVYTLKEFPEGTILQVRVTLLPSNWYYNTITKLMKWSFKFIYDDQFKSFIDYVYDVQYERDVRG